YGHFPGIRRGSDERHLIACVRHDTPCVPHGAHCRQSGGGHFLPYRLLGRNQFTGPDPTLNSHSTGDNSMQQQTKLRRALLKTIVAGTAAFAMGGAAFAQDDNYPNRTVTIVLGFSAGGPTDVVARILADKLSNKFGQTFVVDNKAGASGTVAANYVKKAKPDGYTLMLGSSSTLSIVPNLRKDVQYDPIKDFTAIALVANYPYFLVTPGTSQFNSYD